MGSVGLEDTPIISDRRVWLKPVTRTVSPLRGTVQHASGTLNDLTASGTYTGVGLAKFHVEIATAAAPDTFDWSLRSEGATLASASGVAIVAGAQYLAEGISVTFAATTGHAVGEEWDFLVDAVEDLHRNTSGGYAKRIVGKVRHEAGAVVDEDGRVPLNELYADRPFFRFDGVDDRVQVADDADIDVGVDDFTVQVVFRPETVTAAVQQLLNKESGGIGYGLQLRRERLYLRIDDNTVDASGFVSGSVAALGQVCNAVVVVDRSGNATAYVNGEALDDSALAVSTAALTLANAGVLRVGTESGGTTQPFRGQVYAARAWNYALTAAEARGMSKNGTQAFNAIGGAATEHLQDGGGFGATWTLTNNFAAAGGGLRWLWAGNNTSSATQTSVNRTVAGTGRKRYRFTYDVTSITTPPDGTVTATLTTGFASTAVTLDVASTGRKVFEFESAAGAATGSFVFQVVGSGGTLGEFLLDNFALIEIGVVGEWDGDGIVAGGTWYDGSGNGNDGTATGATAHNLPQAGSVVGDFFVGGNLTVTGNATVNGTTTTFDVDNVITEDPLISLARNNAGNVLDLGLYGQYNDGTERFAGLFRDATDGVFKLFDTLTVEPTTTVATGDGSYDHGDLRVGGLTVDDATSLGGDVTFLAGGDRAISIAAEAADTAGRNLTVSAGAGGAAVAAPGGAGGAGVYVGGTGGAGTGALAAGAGGQVIVAGGNAGATGGGGDGAGGDLLLRGGNASGAAVDGVVRIGATNTSAVIVTPVTTFSALADFDLGATLAAGQAIAGDGALRVGVAAGAFDLSLRMGDAAGAQRVLFEDSAGVTQASVNSDGLGTFTGLSLGSAGARPLKVIGTLGTGWYTWDTNPAAGYFLTLGAESWECVAAAPAGTQFLRDAGTAAATMANFVSRVNSDSAVARAVALDSETAAVFARTVGGGNLALASTDAGVIASAAAMTGSEAAAEKSVIAGTYAVTAADVTAMAPGGENDEVALRTLNSTVAPILVSFEVRDVNGVFKSKATIGARLLQEGAANEWVLAVREQGAGPAVLAATDVISYLCAVTA